MAARIALGIGIDTHKLQRADIDASFLAHFAAAGFLHRLADLDEAARQSVSALERLVFAADQQHTPFTVINDAIGGERRCLRHAHVTADQPRGCGTMRI